MGDPWSFLLTRNFHRQENPWIFKHNLTSPMISRLWPEAVTQFNWTRDNRGFTPKEVICCKCLHDTSDLSEPVSNNTDILEHPNWASISGGGYLHDTDNFAMFLT